jgi:hypothetical protein
MTTMHIVEINARPIIAETNARDYDFSRAAIERRWQACCSCGHGTIPSIRRRKLPCTNLTPHLASSGIVDCFVVFARGTGS